MNKRKLNIVIIASVFLLLVTIIGIKEFIKSNNNQQLAAVDSFNHPVQSELYTKFKNIKSANKVALIVISYKGQCCPRTREYLDKYNQQANSLIKKFKGKTNSLFIDIGMLGNEEKKELIKISTEIGASRLPVLAILGKDGKLKQLITGQFNINNVGNLIWKLSQS